jgi:ADP-ribosylglycohydrolase
LLFSSSEKISRTAEEQSRITHRDSRCAAGAYAIALAVSLAGRQRRVAPDEFLADIAGEVEPIDSSMARAVEESSKWFGLEPAAAAQRLHQSGLDAAHPNWQGISAFVTPSVVWSLYSFLRSPDDYWETVCTAIAVGGDTDSMAAMAGAISGARLGPAAPPAALVARLNDRGEWQAPALTLLARECAALSVES